MNLQRNRVKENDMNRMQAVAPLVRLRDKGLDITLPDGRTSYFNYYWLRDNCPTSFDSVTRERTFDIFHLEQPPWPHTATSRATRW